MKKTLIILLVLSLLSVGALAAPEYLNTEGGTPLVLEGNDITLRITQQYYSGYTGDVEDLWYATYAKNALNVNLDVMQIAGDAFSETLQLMFAAGDLPDIIQDAHMTTAQILQYGQIEKQLLPLNDYLEYMPDFAAWLDADPNLRAAATAPDGNIYSLPYRVDPTSREAISKRVFINKKWVEAVGAEMPETLDELIDLLCLFKEKDPGNVGEDLVPMGGGYNLFPENPTHVVLYAMGFMGNSVDTPALRNGEVTIPAGDPLYIEFLKTLKTMYDEGLISKDFFTLDATQAMASYSEESTGVIFDAPYLYVNDFSDYVAFEPVSSQWCEEKEWLAPSLYSVGNFSVSATTKYPELCAAFGNMNFTTEGITLADQGAPADSDLAYGWSGYKFDENNQRYFVDVASGKYDSDWTYMGGALCVLFPGRYGIAPTDQERNDVQRALAGLEPMEIAPANMEDGDVFYKESIMQNVSPYYTDGYPGLMYFTDEENQRITDLGSVISDYINNQTAKFITGVRSLDEFDAYLEELNKLGYQEYLGYYKTAYSANAQ